MATKHYCDRCGAELAVTGSRRTLAVTVEGWPDDSVGRFFGRELVAELRVAHQYLEGDPDLCDVCIASVLLALVTLLVAPAEGEHGGDDRQAREGHGESGTPAAAPAVSHV